MRGAGHVTGVEEKRNAYRVLEGKSEGRRPLVGPGVDGMTILKRILNK